MPGQFIYEKAPFPSCHASTLVETDGGTILAAWFGGTDEGEKDVGIWLSRYTNGKWSVPEQVAKDKDEPCWNPVLFRERSSGEITLFYKAGPSPERWSGFYRRSTDGGKSWGESYILPAGLLGPIKNKAVQLADGSILAPTSVESYKAWGCWMERSTDGGKTWARFGPIAHPKHPLGIIQPTLFQKKNGELFMLARATSSIGQVCISTSKDGGRTWSTVEGIQALPNPNSGIDGVTLADGRHLLVHNPVHVGRSPLVLSMSTDEGKTWKQVKALEMDPGEYSYPAIIQATDGRVHLSYTWRREKIRHWVVELSELA